MINYLKNGMRTCMDTNYIRNDEEFVVFNLTPTKQLNNTPKSMKGRSPIKEGKEYHHKNSVGNYKL